MGARRRKTLIHGVAAIAGAVLILGLPSTPAIAADHQPVSFSIVLVEPVPEIREQGPNHAVIEWSFSATEFIAYSGPDGRFAANPNLRMTWNWTKAAGRGQIAGTLSTTHFFDPIRWEGEVRGRMTDAGGEGTLHMTEVNTGMKLRAMWTLPAIDPFGDVSTVFFEAAGTVR